MYPCVYIHYYCGLSVHRYEVTTYSFAVFAGKEGNSVVRKVVASKTIPWCGRFCVMLFNSPLSVRIMGIFCAFARRIISSSKTLIQIIRRHVQTLTRREHILILSLGGDLTIAGPALHVQIERPSLFVLQGEEDARLAKQVVDVV